MQKKIISLFFLFLFILLIKGQVKAMCPDISSGASTMPTKCTGSLTGEVSVSPIGGNTPYSFSLGGIYFSRSTSNENWNNVTQTFVGIPAGSYDLIVTDVDGCTGMETVIVAESGYSTFDIDITPADCSSDALITFSSISSNLNSNDSLIIIHETGLKKKQESNAKTFTGLIAGGYIAYIQNTGGKCNTPSVSFRIENLFDVDYTIEQPDYCKVGDEADIYFHSVLRNGNPIANASYSIDGGGSYQLGNVFTGIANGRMVTLKVKDDSDGCASSDIARTIVSTSLISFTPTVVDPVCNGDFGTIDFGSVTGGRQGEYAFFIDGEPAQQNSFQKAGTYSLEVRDEADCQESVTVTLTEPLKVIFDSIVGYAPLCPLDSGELVFYGAAGGSTTGYSYHIYNNSSASQQVITSSLDTIRGLPYNSTYSAFITDSSGCASDVENVSFPAIGFDIVFYDIESSKEKNCSYDTTLDVTFMNVKGGRGIYEYSIKGKQGAFQTSQTFNDLPSDDPYFPFVRHLALDNTTYCYSPPHYTLSIASHDTLKVSHSVTLPTCYGFQDASIEILEVEGGSGGVKEYFLNDQQVFLNEKQGSLGVMEGLDPLLYSLKIIDSDSCIYKENITIPSTDSLGISVTPSSTSCIGTKSGELSVLLETHDPSNTPPGSIVVNYFITIDGGITYANMTTKTRNISSLPEGTYSVRVKDKYGCLSNVVSTSIQSFYQEEFIVATPKITDVLCANQNDGKIQLFHSALSNVPAADQVNAFEVYDAEGVLKGHHVSVSPGGMPTVENLSPGDYEIVAENKINNSKICNSSFKVTVGENSPILVEVLKIEDVVCKNERTGEIKVLASGGSGNYQYSVSHSNGGYSETFFSSESVDFGKLMGGNYTVSVTDENSCTVNENVLISEYDSITFSYTLLDNSCFLFR